MIFMLLKQIYQLTLKIFGFHFFPKANEGEMGDWTWAGLLFRERSIRIFNLFVFFTPPQLSFGVLLETRHYIGQIFGLNQYNHSCFFMFLPHHGLYQVKQGFVGRANVFGVADIEVSINFGYTRPSSEALKKL